MTAGSAVPSNGARSSASQFGGHSANHSGGQRVLVGHPRRSAATVLRAALNAIGVAFVDVAADAEGVAAAAEGTATGTVPDLIVLHSGMLAEAPDLIGRVRAAAGLRDLPVLVLGRFADAGERRRLMAAGATDLLARPVTRAELSARLRLHLENRALNRSLQEVIRSLQTYHTGAMQRMQLAREMQLALLPSDELRGELERRCGVRLASHFESSSELGGDIWGARLLDGGRFAVFLCDFTGHGVAAALNTFRLHALLAKIDLPGDDPAETLGAINRLLVGLLPESQFATMIYAVADVGNDELIYATAGAPKPLVGYPDGSLEVGTSVGLPLGVSPGAVYRNRRMAFPSGAFLFLFSDALHEGRDWEGRPIGYDGVLELMRAGPLEAGNPLADLLERYFAVIPRPLADDLTAVWITRQEE